MIRQRQAKGLTLSSISVTKKAYSHGCAVSVIQSSRKVICFSYCMKFRSVYDSLHPPEAPGTSTLRTNTSVRAIITRSLTFSITSDMSCISAHPCFGIITRVTLEDERSTTFAVLTYYQAVNSQDLTKWNGH